MFSIRESYQRNKTTYTIFGLLLLGFFITGTVLIIKIYISKVKGRKANEGIQQSTIDYVSKEEGRKYLSYKDSVGKDTVGVGHLILPNENHLVGKELTDIEVDTLLKKDLQIASDSILKNVTGRKLNQNQFDALISLVFNIGVGAFQSSTLLKYLNNPNTPKENIINSWLAWKRAGGQVLTALENRRKRETELFYS